MKKFILLTMALLSLNIPAFASSDAPPVDSKQDVEKLIGTLENPAEREKLIGNLRLLIDQNKAEESTTAETIIPDITEKLGVRDAIGDAVQNYEEFLDKNAISASVFQQSIGTIIVLMIGAGFLLGVRQLSFKIIVGVDKLSEKIGIRLTRIFFYAKVFQTLLKALICGLIIYTVSKIWNLAYLVEMFEGDAMRSFLTSALTVFVIAVVATLIWEAIGIYLSYILKQADNNNQTRVKTLLPLIRNIVLIIFGILFGLVLMSEMGINVAPLLAGAGVLGVAIGFGAQSMVKDFLTGFTIVLEDIIRVGDVATLAGNTGVVEKITMRKVQLRDFAGIVYTIPFSEITTIQNHTKDFSFYVFNVSISYNENSDRVIEVLKGISIELEHDDIYASSILAPLEIVGVDAFADSAVIIKARIKTKPLKQWEVGREFNRRMKHAFDKNNIEIPFPQRVITVVSNQTNSTIPPATLEQIAAQVD